MTDRVDRLYWSVLVIRCQVGDRSAFEELVKQCQPRLHRFLHRMLAGRHNVDDVAQEVWMEVFRDLRKLNDPGAFLSWLYRIARNRVFRILRRRREIISSLEDVEEPNEVDKEPEFTIEDAQDVHTALDRLGAEHREVLLLRFIEKMSYEEIAVVADCQIGTVRSRIFNAKRALRKILETGERS